MKNMIITEDVIQQHIQNTGQCFIRDGILTGFGIRIYPSGKVSYIVEPVVQGSTRRKMIGKHPLLSMAEARELAKEKIRELTAASSHPCSYSPATRSIPLLSEAYKAHVSQIQLKPSTNWCCHTYLAITKFYSGH